MKAPFEGDVYLEDWMRREIHCWEVTHVVETGTETGATSDWFSRYVSKVFTCDIRDQRDREFPGNVDFRVCPSVELLREVCPTLLGSRVLFWLDAHCVLLDSCALPDEVKVLSDYVGEEWLIGIHDFEVPGHSELGFDTYPTFGPLNLQNVEPLIRPFYVDGYSIAFNTHALGASRGVVLFCPI